MLDVLAWAMIVFVAFGAIATIFLIGVPRKAIGPGTAVFTLIVSMIEIGVILALLNAAHRT